MLFFDIETDGLLDDLTKIHCMCIIDDSDDSVHLYRPDEITEGVKKLNDALQNGIQICGHNIIKFDISAIEKLYPYVFHVSREARPLVVDTLVLSHLMYSECKGSDMGLFKRGILPGNLIGSHSLKAWGYRLGELKGTYANDHGETAWDAFNEDMLKYNQQDVVVTRKLYEYLMNHFKCYPQDAIELEHKAQWLMAQQERNGFTFDLKKAETLEETLRSRFSVLDNELRQIIPKIPDKVFIPKRDNKTLGYKKGVPIQRYKDFNPKSRQQLEWLILNHYHYKPSEPDLWEEDRLKIDDETFKYLKENPDGDVPEELQRISGVMEEYLMISKRLGQLIDGSYGWLKMVKPDGKIHGTVNPCGTVTGRATHAFPNVAQVPASHSPYGKECRELFRVPDGWYEAGIDASGLELRCLAHYLYRYDHGGYAHEILNGDIHTANQKAAGLPTRDQAKTFIYAYLYGAGDAKMGKIINGTAKEGKAIKKRFLEHTPAVAQLRDAIKHTLVASEFHGEVKNWKRKYLFGLDRRPLKVRSFHSALNLLLQSAGALICKYWIVTLEDHLIALGYDHGKDFQYMAWVHDEVQIACRTKEIAEVVCKEAARSMLETGDHYHFHVRLDVEGKIGKNWYDCH